MGPPFRPLGRRRPRGIGPGEAAAAPEADPRSGLLDIGTSLPRSGSPRQGRRTVGAVTGLPARRCAGCPPADRGIGSVVVRPSEGIRAAGGRSLIEDVSPAEATGLLRSLM